MLSVFLASLVDVLSGTAVQMQVQVHVPVLQEDSETLAILFGMMQCDVTRLGRPKYAAQMVSQAVPPSSWWWLWDWEVAAASAFIIAFCLMLQHGCLRT